MNDSKPVAQTQKGEGGGMGIRYTAYAAEEHISHSLMLSIFRENRQEFKIQEQLPLWLFVLYRQESPRTLPERTQEIWPKQKSF
jgi:hypothetical protein